MAMRGCSVAIAESVSSNGYQYTPASLKQMADQLIGKSVLRKEPVVDDAEGDLRDVCGVVCHAEVIEGKVIASIAWFSDCAIPVGKFLTPTGQGKLEFGKIESYTATHLTVSDVSAFECAERIADV